MYFNIGEYASALDWVQRYLNGNDKNPAAYKLLGQCYEKLKRPDKQLAAYQRSLELDRKQSDLLVEVCKLLQNEELSGITPAKARYWYELAEQRNIHHEAVLNLKLKFLGNTAENGNNGEAVNSIQEIISNEIVRRPHDVGLRIRLVYHILEQKRVDEAFKYVFDIEMKQVAQFRNSSDWYTAVSQVLTKYKEKYDEAIRKNWSYWLLLISVNERQLYLSLVRSPDICALAEQNLTEATNYLFELDQNLSKLVAINAFPDSERELAAEFTAHYRGQLCLHAASLLFKREMNMVSRSNWQETLRTALPLLLFAYNCGCPVRNTLPWLKGASETTKHLINHLHTQSCFRMAQAGRTLQSCVNSPATSDNAALVNLRKICTDKYSAWSTQDDVLNEIRSIVADTEWRKKLYRKLYHNKEQQKVAIAYSYLVQSKSLELLTYEWPENTALVKFEEIAQTVEPSLLSHMVYIMLGNDDATKSKDTLVTINPDIKCTLFKELGFSASNLLNCGAETLNQLDVDAFLYAAAIQAKRNIVANASKDQNKPKILPYANMVNILCTDEQSDWWTAAYKVRKILCFNEFRTIHTAN